MSFVFRFNLPPAIFEKPNRT